MSAALESQCDHLTSTLFSSLQDAGPWEAFVVLLRRSNLRFADSRIHQTLDEVRTDYTLRLFHPGFAQVASADASDQGVATAVAKAKRIASQRTSLYPEPEPVKPVPPLGCYDSQAACLDAAQKTELLARGFGTTLSFHGAYDNGEATLAYLNHHGGTIVHRTTFCGLSLIGEKGHASHYEGARGWRFFDPQALFERFASFTFEKTGELRPGRYPVVLSPYCLSEILEWMSFLHLNWKAKEEGNSFLDEEIELSPLITLLDDGTDLSGLPLAFDFEGRAKRPFFFVEEGRFCNLAFNRYYARKLGRHGSCHGGPDIRTPMIANLVCLEGPHSLEEVFGLEEGVYIHRFHYVNGYVDPPRALFTGLTRDGIYRIRSGRLAGRLPNFRFRQSFQELLAQVTRVSKETRTLGNDWYFLGTARCPYLQAPAFHLESPAR